MKLSLLGKSIFRNATSIIVLLSPVAVSKVKPYRQDNKPISNAKSQDLNVNRTFLLTLTFTLTTSLEKPHSLLIYKCKRQMKAPKKL